MAVTYAYAGSISKTEKTPEGLMVFGKATGPDLDHDGQICDPAWLAVAMPEWAKWSNVRAQHGHVVAGVGKELSQDGGSWWLKALIVDADSIRKVESGAYKGYSIGIANATVVKDRAAPNGRICSGQIVEISLVDRPSNPTATMSISKMAGFPGSRDGVLTPGGKAFELRAKARSYLEQAAKMSPYGQTRSIGDSYKAMAAELVKQADKLQGVHAHAYAADLAKAAELRAASNRPGLDSGIRKAYIAAAMKLEKSE